MRFPVRLLSAVVLALPAAAPALTESQRRAHLDWMLANLPAVPSWRAWQQSGGTLPPDFDALPRANFLPDPLRFHDGRPVAWPSDWPARRAEIKSLFQTYVLGSLPPKPTLDRVVPAGDPVRFSGYSVRTVTLHYGPGQRLTSQVTLTLPEVGGPFPVVIGGGSWAAALLRRGYAVCEFPSGVDQVTDLPALYPHHDFATIAQRAWTVQLVVDYLLTVPEIDPTRLALTGYSRGGKMALTAAAFDDRIAAVIAGSTGVGGVTPWRLAGERGAGEGVESTTRMFPLWFAPQLRFFAGHEDRLPVDANLLMALVAPRALLATHGLNDEVANVWANEQAYASALRVYRAHDAPDRLGLLRLPGFHGANDIEGCIDWLDCQFGRSPRTWRTDLLYPWNFDVWRARVGESFDPGRFPADPPPKSPSETRAAIAWLLGPTPTRYTPPAGGRGGPPVARGGPVATPTKPVANPGQLAPDVPAWVIARNSQEFGWRDPERSAADSRRIRFGSGLGGDLYFPAGTPSDRKLPAVVWLHGYSHPLGYMWVYRRDLHPILALVQAGFAVLAFDQCGFGSRQAEIGPFYDRYPRWSHLGRLVDDARAALDALEREPGIDASRLSLFGYTLGGTVALHAAALDPRVKSVVAISGFTPFRRDTASGTGGLARYSHERPLVPRLGWFIGHESRVPYDYDDVLAALAPRPVLIVQPTMDRDADPVAVRETVARARRAYGTGAAALALDEPHDYQRLPAATQARAVAWLKAQP